MIGVDLANGDTLVSNEVVPPTKEAVVRAVWLAKANSARLLFFHVLPPANLIYTLYHSGL